MESILTSIKKLLGIAEECTDFDGDIITHINSVFLILRQLGVGPSDGFSICDDQTLWSDFIGDQSMLDAVRSYIYLKVRLLFDPPQNSSLLEAVKENARELEFRLNVSAEFE